MSRRSTTILEQVAGAHFCLQEARLDLSFSRSKDGSVAGESFCPLSRDREREGGDHTIGVCAIPDAGNRLNDVSGSINTKKSGKRLVVRDQNKRILALAETHER